MKVSGLSTAKLAAATVVLLSIALTTACMIEELSLYIPTQISS